MSRSVQPTNYSQRAPVEYRVEITGNLINYIPVKATK